MMQDAVVETGDGIFYVIPKNPKEKAELKVYSRKPNGDLQLLQTYKYSIKYLPNPQKW